MTRRVAAGRSHTLAGPARTWRAWALCDTPTLMLCATHKTCEEEWHVHVGPGGAGTAGCQLGAAGGRLKAWPSGLARNTLAWRVCWWVLLRRCAVSLSRVGGVAPPSPHCDRYPRVLVSRCVRGSGASNFVCRHPRAPAAALGANLSPCSWHALSMLLACLRTPRVCASTAHAHVHVQLRTTAGHARLA